MFVSVRNLVVVLCCFFFFQAEDVIRYLVRSRGLGDVYKRQDLFHPDRPGKDASAPGPVGRGESRSHRAQHSRKICLLYTSDAADERPSVDLGGRRIIKKKNHRNLAIHSRT